MANYPNSLPTTKSRSDSDMSASETHTTWHDTDEEEIIAIATELGTTPSGSFSTVKDRLDAVATRIERKVTSGSVSSLTFSGIPATFGHLRLVARPSHDNASTDDTFRTLGLRFNGDSSSLYDFNLAYILGGGSLNTQTDDNAAQSICGHVGSQPGSLIIDIPDYRSSGTGSRTFNASGSSRTGSVTSAATRLILGCDGVWGSGAAITSVTIFIAVANGDAFTNGLVFTLYGLP